MAWKGETTYVELFSYRCAGVMWFGGGLRRTQTPPISNSKTIGLLEVAEGGGILNVVPKRVYVLLFFVQADDMSISSLLCLRYPTAIGQRSSSGCVLSCK